MTTHELLVLLRDALADDMILDRWCVEQFGKSPTVYLGIDEENPPPEEDYPVVAIVGADHVRGEAERETGWPVFIGVAIVNTSIETDGKKRTYVGLLQAEALREHAENAIYRARIAGVGSSGNASQESFFPLFVSYSTVTVKELRSTRRAMP